MLDVGGTPAFFLLTDLPVLFEQAKKMNGHDQLDGSFFNDDNFCCTIKAQE